MKPSRHILVYIACWVIATAAVGAFACYIIPPSEARQAALLVSAVFMAFFLALSCWATWPQKARTEPAEAPVSPESAERWEAQSARLHEAMCALSTAVGNPCVSHAKSLELGLVEEVKRRLSEREALQNLVKELREELAGAEREAKRYIGDRASGLLAADLIIECAKAATEAAIARAERAEAEVERLKQPYRIPDDTLAQLRLEARTEANARIAEVEEDARQLAKQCDAARARAEKAEAVLTVLREADEKGYLKDKVTFDTTGLERRVGEALA